MACKYWRLCNRIVAEGRAATAGPVKGDEKAHGGELICINLNCEKLFSGLADKLSGPLLFYTISPMRPNVEI